MYLNNYGSDSLVHYETLNNPTRFVLQFTNLYYCCGQNTPHNFEMILFPNGDILAQYQSLNGTSTNYVGIENQDGSIGLSYGDTLSDSLAIQYYYPSGLFLTPPNSSGYGLVGSTVSYTLQLANQSGFTGSHQPKERVDPICQFHQGPKLAARRRAISDQRTNGDGNQKQQVDDESSNYRAATPAHRTQQCLSPTPEKGCVEQCREQQCVHVGFRDS